MKLWDRIFGTDEQLEDERRRLFLLGATVTAAGLVVARTVISIPKPEPELRIVGFRNIVIAAPGFEAWLPPSPDPRGPFFGGIDRTVSLCGPGGGFGCDATSGQIKQALIECAKKIDLYGGVPDWWAGVRS